jgi:hypothetical protein
MSRAATLQIAGPSESIHQPASSSDTMLPWRRGRLRCRLQRPRMRSRGAVRFDCYDEGQEFQPDVISHQTACRTCFCR